MVSQLVNKCCLIESRKVSGDLPDLVIYSVFRHYAVSHFQGGE